MIRRLLSCAAAACLSIAASARAAPPVAAFGRLPAIQDAAISPNGERIAILGGPANLRQVSIATIDDPDVKILGLGRVIARSVRWAGDDYVLTRTQVQDPFFKKDVYNFVRDIVVDTNGKAIARLSDPDDFPMLAFPILRIIPGPKPQAFVATVVQSQESMRTNDTRMKGTNDTWTPAIRKLDVRTGRGPISERASDNTDNWAVDLTGESRVRFDSVAATSTYTILGRPKGVSSWKVIFQTKDQGDLDDFLGYSDPADSVYFAERADGRFSVVQVSLKTGERTRIGPDAKVDSAGLLLDPYTDAVIGLAIEGEATQVEWKDAQLAAVHAKLSRALKGQMVNLESWSEDRTKFLVSAESPDHPPVWYLLDEGKKQLSPVVDAYPELKDVPLGTTTWFTYKARDGLEIPAYLTMPPGVTANAPLIVLPHGGPASRDDYSFDYETQFLASRGYAVLRPQFRGSSGFGRAFEEAGHREWAGKMQTDLLDGVAAAAANGLVDSKRVCIVGASYGGYSALASAAFYGSNYRCAVAVAPVADLARMLGDAKVAQHDFSLAYWRRLLGRETGSDAAALAKSSPVNNAEKINIPVLLIHGKDDTTVKYEQSILMRDAMKAAGKPVDLVTLDGDDHYMSTSETRTKMLEATEAFLARNNPVN